MADTTINFIESQTIQSSPAGNIEFTSSNGVNQVNITHTGGSNISFSDYGSSTFSPKNTQSLTLKDDFSTVYGSKSIYTRKTLDQRVEGDSVELIGPTSMIVEETMKEWFDCYADGIGAIQAQWPDNRFELPDDAYPKNPMFSHPDGIDTITSAPPLLDGLAENNKDNNSKLDFESKMMIVEGKPNPFEESESTKNLRTELTEQYTDKTKNLAALNAALNGNKQ